MILHENSDLQEGMKSIKNGKHMRKYFLIYFSFFPKFLRGNCLEQKLE